MKRQPRGFTLIEVLVALAIVAVALAAGTQATSALTRAASRQSDQWLAQLCAENELIRIRLQAQMPGTGESTTECQQAGQVMQVHVLRAPTPNPNFRRVDAVVEATVDGSPVRLLNLSTIVGRF
ncbi:MAG: type II secretion system minor pseudopilin GspI [Hydrogenophaga sp.]|nr:type II secretion system minor pseudopilin GspI [Hydrogenophaga sp.]